MQFKETGSGGVTTWSAEMAVTSGVTEITIQIALRIDDRVIITESRVTVIVQHSIYILSNAFADRVRTS